MKKSYKLLFLVLGLSLMIIPFNNCGEYSDSSLFQSSETPEECSEPSNCLTPKPELVKIQTNTSEVLVFPLQRYLNIGGTCHDGGYKNNSIKYELKDSGTLIHNYTAITLENCVNGRFQASIDLQNLSHTGIDYTGGFPNDIHQDLILSASLYGVDAQGNLITSSKRAVPFFVRRVESGL